MLQSTDWFTKASILSICECTQHGLFNKKYMKQSFFTSNLIEFWHYVAIYSYYNSVKNFYKNLCFYFMSTYYVY